MNIGDWKTAAELHAGTPLKWTDRKDPWRRAVTAWADGPTWTYSIIMGNDPPAVRYRGKTTIPLELPAEENQCQNKNAPTVTEPENVITATALDVNGVTLQANAKPAMALKVNRATLHSSAQLAMIQGSFL